MALSRSVIAAASLVAAANGVAVEQRETARANPIRRVVNMLQDMQAKVKAEGERDEELFEKYMCYCKNGAGKLEGSISAAETKIPQVDSSIKEAESLHAQLEADLKQHKSDRADAKDAVAKATGIREKEAATFAKDSGDAKTNIAAMGKAIAALEKGATGFLQTSAASVLRRLSIEMDLSSTDRDMLSSFLTGSSGYVPQSGEITGILKQMKDTMEKDLADMTAAEESAKQNFDALVKAKDAEIAANTKAIEAKTVRSGEVAVEIVNLKEDLDDTSKALVEDKKFLADLDKNCATKKDEYDVVVKTRAEEQVALAETIKILNDDDALDLFKKTLPSSSLLQVTATDRMVRNRALQALQKGKRGKDTGVDLIMLALRGKAVDFGKVTKMIDEMVVNLGNEQKDDDSKKAYCEEAFDRTDDENKALQQTIADLTKAMEEAESNIAQLASEIKALTEGIADLDKQVTEATETRKEEHEEYTTTMANNNAAKELIGLAKNRMNKFYNKALYKAPPKRELSEEDRIAVNLGGATAPPTPAPGGIAGTGVTGAFIQDEEAPAPPPEAVPAYSKKSEESTGVIGLMDMLIADLDKEMQEMEVNEKDAQSEYETFMQDSADKRKTDSALIAEKEQAKADTEAALEHAKSEKTATQREHMAKVEEIGALHQECDWLVANFAARKEARTGEIESLKNAKAVLAGADYSLIQINAHRA